MSSPARNRLSGETAPDAPAWWKDRVLPVLQGALGDVSASLAKGLTRQANFVGDSDDVSFTTAAVLADTWPVLRKHRMATRPQHVICSQIARKDGTALSAAWSMTWKLNQRNELELTFQGLSTSTDYVARVVYE